MTEYSNIAIEYLKRYADADVIEIIGEQIDYEDVTDIFAVCESKIQGYNPETSPEGYFKETILIIGNMFDVLSKAFYKYNTLNRKQYNNLERQRMKINSKIMRVMRNN